MPGNKVPQKLKQFIDIVSDFDCRNDQSLKILHNSLASMFHGEGG